MFVCVGGKDVPPPGCECMSNHVRLCARKGRDAPYKWGREEDLVFIPLNTQLLTKEFLYLKFNGIEVSRMYIVHYFRCGQYRIQ